jgi:exopolyphosphatase/guanosine-5'-triphosphate,3'-diphosphate pyrophosphatase
VGRGAGLLAAVDLGSNSFHLVVARFHHGQVSVMDRLREPVRLAEGLKPDGSLDHAVAQRALACLERFGQRLRSMDADNVRVVGTSALRRIRGKDFLARARNAVGHPIEVVSGIEEARLIYSGVAHVSPPVAGRRLVVDIGGGSTELIVGEGMAPLEMASLQMGCVGYSAEFFPGGRSTVKRMRRARLAARQQLEPVFARLRRCGWDQVLGSSGTIKAIGEALAELNPGTSGIEIDPLLDLTERIANGPDMRELAIEALSHERREVIAGGIAILAETFEMLGIERMHPTDGAMRDGLLYDLIGRMSDSDDARERSVRAMQQRYHVDVAQAARVEATAQSLLTQVAPAWGLEDDLNRRLLSWAARLHEIGLDVAHSKFHLHGAYLLANADMPAFANNEQRLLAMLVGNHRRRPLFENLDQIAADWQQRVVCLTVLLRVAAVLHRGRSADPLPKLDIEVGEKRAVLYFPGRWLRAHPLTMADLAEEEKLLRGYGFRLKVFSRR